MCIDLVRVEVVERRRERETARPSKSDVGCMVPNVVPYYYWGEGVKRERERLSKSDVLVCTCSS